MLMTKVGEDMLVNIITFDDLKLAVRKTTVIFN